MSKIFLLIGAMLLSDINANDYFDLADRSAFLAGTTNKTWYMYTLTPESAIASCKAEHARSLDNTYTFYANGTYEFDHGSITNDPTCEGEGCCSDFINIAGTWGFTNDQTHILVKALHEKENAGNTLDMVLYDATILSPQSLLQGTLTGAHTIREELCK